MIDTDKYEGHDLSTDEKMSDAIEYIQGSIFHDEDEGRIAEANAQLIADAPLLLEEVKRLREQLDLAYEFVVNGFIEPVAIQFDNYVRGVGEEG